MQIGLAEEEIDPIMKRTDAKNKKIHAAQVANPSSSKRLRKIIRADAFGSEP